MWKGYFTLTKEEILQIFEALALPAVVFCTLLMSSSHFWSCSTFGAQNSGSEVHFAYEVDLLKATSDI
jgi:hypothetical protein